MTADELERVFSARGWLSRQPRPFRTQFISLGRPVFAAARVDRITRDLVQWTRDRLDRVPMSPDCDDGGVLKALGQPHLDD